MRKTFIEMSYISEFIISKIHKSGVKILSNISEAAATVSEISREVPKIQLDTYDQYRNRRRRNRSLWEMMGENLNIMENELLRFGGVNVSLGWYGGPEIHLGIRKVIVVDRKNWKFSCWSHKR